MITIRYTYVIDEDNKILGRFVNEEVARKRYKDCKEYLRYRTRSLDLKEAEDVEVHTEYNIVFFPNDGGKHGEVRTYTGKKRPPHVDAFITCDYVTFYSSESEEHCRKLLTQNIDKALHWVNVVRFTFEHGVSPESLIKGYQWNLDL